MPRECLGLAAGVGGSDDDPVEDGGDLAHVDGEDVVRLDVLEGGDDELLLAGGGNLLH
jgi:hypothetical protein